MNQKDEKNKDDEGGEKKQKVEKNLEENEEARRR
jgi:hypothetical protein